MKGQADPVQEEDDVAEDPDPLGSTDCDVSPINGACLLLLSHPFALSDCFLTHFRLLKCRYSFGKYWP